MIMENLALILNVQFLIFLLLLLLNFNDLKNSFKNIKKITWLILILIILFAPLLFKSHFVFIEDLTIAKDLFMGGDYFVKNSRYGPFYPYLIYISFLIFGVNVNVVNYFETLFLVLSIFGVFLMSYFITKKEGFSLVASVMYLLTAFMISLYFYGLHMNIYHFLLVFSLLFSLFSYRVNKWKAYSLALLTIYFAGMTRFEMMGLLYVFIIGFFIFKRDYLKIKNLRKFKTLLFKIGTPFMIFLIFSSVYFMYVDYSTHRWQNRELSPVNELISRGVLWPSFDYFSPEFFDRSLKGLFDFVMSPPALLFLFSSVAGLCLMTKSYKGIAVFLTLAFIAMLPPYLLCSTCFQPRYFLYIIIPLLVFSAYTLYELVKLSIRLEKYNLKIPKIRFKMTRKMFFASLLLILLIFSFLYSLPIFSNASTFTTLERDPIREEFYKISETINNLSGIGENESVIIITSENAIYDEIRFLTLKKAFQLQDIIKSTEIHKKIMEDMKPRIEATAGPSTLFYNISAMKEAEDTAKMILLKAMSEIEEEYEKGGDPLSIRSIKEDAIYFFESPACNSYVGNKVCELITKNFNLNLLKEANGYKLYTITR